MEIKEARRSCREGVVAEIRADKGGFNSTNRRFIQNISHVPRGSSTFPSRNFDRKREAISSRDIMQYRSLKRNKITRKRRKRINA